MESWKVYICGSKYSGCCLTFGRQSCKSRTAMGGSAYQYWLWPQAGSQTSWLQRARTWDPQTICGWTFHSSLCSWQVEECLQHQLVFLLLNLSSNTLPKMYGFVSREAHSYIKRYTMCFVWWKAPETPAYIWLILHQLLSWEHLLENNYVFSSRVALAECDHWGPKKGS